MTAEILLVLLLAAVALVAGGLGALILATFGQTGWFVILAVAVTAVLVWRLAAARLTARADWLRDDLRDEWRAG